MQENLSAPVETPVARDRVLDFLYRAPMGLMQLSPNGNITSMNATAQRLLSGLAGGVRPKNLFASVGEAGATLSQRLSAFTRPSGTICDALKVPIRGTATAPARTLSLGLFKLDAARLLVTLSDATAEQPDDERTARRRALAAELRQALADGQLFVQYQPVVGLPPLDSDFVSIERNAAVEALVRWNHRIRGAVSPFEFITVAEEFGLIGELGDFILHSACRQFVRWTEELADRAPRRLAVNLCRGQLAHPDFVHSVRRILEATGMAPEHLQLEVNEGLAASDPPLQGRLKELSVLGIKLALDNFGTGSSSLANLHQLPVELIKIDRSFVNSVASSVRHRVLIDATVKVAASLGMFVGAEGIETKAQLETVRQLGCVSAQGFFFSEAVSAANLSHWLSSEDALL